MQHYSFVAARDFLRFPEEEWKIKVKEQRIPSTSWLKHVISLPLLYIYEILKNKEVDGRKGV